MVNRRRFISLLSAASLGALAGCPMPPSPPDYGTDSPTESTGTTETPKKQQGISGVKPSDPPPQIRPYNCGGDNTLQHKPFVDFGEVVLGETDTWKLEASTTTASIGQAITIRLTNKTEYIKKTASKWKFNIQVYTQNGWQEIRRVTNQQPYSSNEISHQGGGGFEWQFVCTNTEFFVMNPFQDNFEICPTIQPGRYRFIFADPAVSVQFNIVE